MFVQIEELFDTGKETDPMEGDVFDPDESLNRRIEIVETKDHGSVFVRVMGDPTDPLILYLHGNHSKSNTSAFWNKIAVEVARRYQAPATRSPRDASGGQP